MQEQLQTPSPARTHTGEKRAPAPIAGVVDRALNAYLRRLDDPERSLNGLAGRVLIVELTDLGWVFQIIFSIDRVHVRGRGELPPDTRLSGSVIAFGDAAAHRFRELPTGIEVHGDAEVAQHFTRLLAEADIDWEEALARRIGDFPAHQMGRLTRSVAAWSRRVVKTLTADVGEYLQEEARYLPSRAEIDAFLGDVDALRNDCDRLEARMKRLQETP
ncbi:MAG TPA: SCP2 sterol-binding domain-containing protein [Gammaproteobacteria bacterium]|nr:SCP2 sterol-binding domain-containing protein [Gammaproteobacteria bacterium]